MVILVVSCVILASLAALACPAVALCVYFSARKSHDLEIVRLMCIFESAMMFSKAANATDKVTADATKKSADLQLRMLEDAIALDKDQKDKAKQEANPAPKWVSGFDKDGNAINVDMNEGWAIVE